MDAYGLEKMSPQLIFYLLGEWSVYLWTTCHLHPLAACKERYVRHIGQNGVFLGLLDASLLCRSWTSNVMLVIYDNEFQGAPAARPLMEALHRQTGGAVGNERMDLHDSESLDTFFLVACRADFVRASFLELNHYVPAWSRQQLGLLWDSLVSQTTNKLAKKLSNARARLNLLDSDEEDLEVCRETQIIEIEKLEHRQEFFAVMFGMDLFPVEVPADGNCMLWSLRSLRCGPSIRTSLTNNEKVAQTREDTCLEPGFEGRCDDKNAFVLIWPKKLRILRILVLDLNKKNRASKPLVFMVIFGDAWSCARRGENTVHGSLYKNCITLFVGNPPVNCFCRIITWGILYGFTGSNGRGLKLGIRFGLICIFVVNWVAHRCL